MKKLRFDELSLSSEVQRAVADMGFTEASPIQSEAIPFILEGRDLIGQAQTGTGKTAAFGIPGIELVDDLDRNVQLLIMCPTRELALQVSEELRKLAKYKRDIRIAAIYGGESIERQIRTLKMGVQIVVGTPGRIQDHIDRGTLRLDKVKMAVLDEADEMLDMGFREDIEAILSRTPEEKQTIFFSATMSKEILAMTKRFQKDPHMVKIQRNEVTAPEIEQLYYEVNSRHKAEAFARLVTYYDLKLMLVFCNTKKMVDELVEKFQERGMAAEGLHGDMRQQQRNSVMAKFRAGTVNILIATDVAARGIDVNNVDAVFNYDLPMNTENYVHRIGRTGRAGKSGMSFTFVNYRDLGGLRDIERYTKSKINKGTLPSTQDIINIQKKKFAEQVNEVIEQGNLEQYQEMALQLLEQGQPIENTIAALIKMNMNVFQGEEIPTGSDRSERGARGNERGGGRGEREFSRGSERERGFGRGNDREERKPRAAGGRTTYNGPMTRLFINIGKKANVRPGDIVGAIAGETNLPGSKIGSIDIYDKFSFVEVPNENAQDVITIMDNNQIKGKRINVEIAGDRF